MDKYFKSDEISVKVKVDLLNKYNMTRCLANYKLSTSYHYIDFSGRIYKKLFQKW